MTPAVGAGVAVAAVCVLAGAGGKVPICDSKAWMWLAIDGGLVVGLGLLLMTVATQNILSSEAALLGLLEMLFGPLFVFFGVGERPNVFTIVAGAVLLCTLAGHEIAAMREEKESVDKTEEKQHCHSPEEGNAEGSAADAVSAVKQDDKSDSSGDDNKVIGDVNVAAADVGSTPDDVGDMAALDVAAQRISRV